MKISWVVADSAVLDPGINVEQIKNIGSIWGGWRTWRGCGTDNVVCNDLGKARELLQRKFNEICNFYVPKPFYVDLDRPSQVHLYEGQFTFEVDNPEELIAMHLAASQSDIVLLLGFNLLLKSKNSDRLIEHCAQNYRTTIKHLVNDNPQVQWLLIDHPDGKLIDELKNVDNVTRDTLLNIIG